VRLDSIAIAQTTSFSHPPRLQDNVIDVKEIKSILYLTINAQALLEPIQDIEKHAVDTFV
jgi:hypothetical protein